MEDNPCSWISRTNIVKRDTSETDIQVNVISIKISTEFLTDKKNNPKIHMELEAILNRNSKAGDTQSQIQSFTTKLQ